MKECVHVVSEQAVMGGTQAAMAPPNPGGLPGGGGI